MDPVTYGDYPRSMRVLVGNRLPKFTKEESQLLRGSMDYLGLNYFTANYTHYARPPHKSHPSYLTDSWANLKSKGDASIFELLHMFMNDTTITSHHVLICVAERNGMPIGLPVSLENRNFYIASHTLN